MLRKVYLTLLTAAIAISGNYTPSYAKLSYFDWDHPSIKGKESVALQDFKNLCPILTPEDSVFDLGSSDLEVGETKEQYYIRAAEYGRSWLSGYFIDEKGAVFKPTNDDIHFYENIGNHRGAKSPREVLKEIGKTSFNPTVTEDECKYSYEDPRLGFFVLTLKPVRLINKEPVLISGKSAQ